MRALLDSVSTVFQISHLVNHSIHLPHCSSIFSHLADDMSAQNSNEEVPMAGINSILPKEHGNKFYTLQILQHLEKDVCAMASWDSSLHDSLALNRVTEGKYTSAHA